MTHAEYLQEPADVVAWALSIERIEAEVQRELDERAQRAGQSR